MSPNDADGMANSVDPDQTTPLGKPRIITVPKFTNICGNIIFLIFANSTAHEF